MMAGFNRLLKVKFVLVTVYVSNQLVSEAFATVFGVLCKIFVRKVQLTVLEYWLYQLRFICDTECRSYFGFKKYNSVWQQSF